MTVSLISAGRVGTAVGEKLAAAGHRVYTAVAPSPESKYRAYTRLPHASLKTPVEAVTRSQLVVLSVPDPTLAEVVEEIEPHVQERQIILHTSGSHGVGILDPLARRGAVTIAAHPAMTFSGSERDTADLDGCAWGVTASGQLADTVAELLIAEMNGRTVRIAEDKRTLYHAAMAHGSNHAAAIALQASRLLGDCIVGADSDSAYALLGPLMRASITRVLTGGASQLTGPTARDDVTTVQAHRDAIAKTSNHTIADSYDAMARAVATELGSEAVGKIVGAENVETRKH